MSARKALSVDGEVHLERGLEGREPLLDRLLAPTEATIQRRERFLVQLALAVQGAPVRHGEAALGCRRSCSSVRPFMAGAREMIEAFGIHILKAELLREERHVRLYRRAAAILAAVEAGVFAPRVGWHCQDCPVRSRCWAWSNRGRASRTGRRSVPGSAAACSLSSASPA
jgi:hypothetical protein